MDNLWDEDRHKDSTSNNNSQHLLVVLANRLHHQIDLVHHHPLSKEERSCRHHHHLSMSMLLSLWKNLSLLEQLHRLLREVKGTLLRHHHLLPTSLSHPNNKLSNSLLFHHLNQARWQQKLFLPLHLSRMLHLLLHHHTKHLLMRNHQQQQLQQRQHITLLLRHLLLQGNPNHLLVRLFHRLPLQAGLRLLNQSLKRLRLTTPHLHNPLTNRICQLINPHTKLPLTLKPTNSNNIKPHNSTSSLHNINNPRNTNNRSKHPPHRHLQQPHHLLPPAEPHPLRPVAADP